MVTTVVIGMLCVHLLCFSLMFLLISRRLHGKKMGMDVFALGNLMLGLAYVLQLFGGHANGSVMSIVNHTLTLCAPVTYVLGGLRFFDYPIRIWRPLLATAAGYTAVQILVQVLLGTEARHALLAGSCAALFLAMAVAVLYVGTTLARDLRVEMGVFAVLIGGICALNAAKLLMILSGGLQALDYDTGFQKVFYLYMSFLGTVLPPCFVWLVLRRLVQLDTLAQQLFRLASMSLRRGHELQGAVAMFMVVPGHEAVHPVPGLLQRVEGPLRPQRAVLRRAEQGLGIGVVIAHPRAAERGHHAQVLHGRQHGRALHRAAVVRVQYQRLACPLFT